ncbi:hypothetical protein HK405_010358 [Cladochytrium tenue]|nr:hypothetical protein HK405_010358 [Cladochytrium tenue]
MKHLLVVNPNATTSMTEGMKLETAELQKELGKRGVVFDFFTAPGSKIQGYDPTSAPPAIEGTVDSIRSASACFAALFSDPSRGPPRPITDYDGILVACYSDHPLVPMLREALTGNKPVAVLGIMQASVLRALALGARRVAVVTTAKRWEELLDAGIRAMGVSGEVLAPAGATCGGRGGVLSTGLGVLELESLPKAEVVQRVSGAAERLVRDAGADAVCLGCAGMVGLKEAVEAAVAPYKERVGGRVLVLDSVTAGITLLSGLV